MQIETSCNIKPGLCGRYYLLVCVHCFFSNVRLESPYNLLIWHHRYTTGSHYLDVLLYKDFLTLLHHHNQVKDHVQQPNQLSQLNIARYKKAVSTTIWLQLTVAACYLPLGVVTALAISGGRSLFLYNTWYYTVTLAYFNSSLNPILYCWKIGEVRQAVKNTIRQVLCYCFST